MATPAEADTEALLPEGGTRARTLRLRLPTRRNPWAVAATLLGLVAALASAALRLRAKPAAPTAPAETIVEAAAAPVFVQTADPLRGHYGFLSEWGPGKEPLQAAWAMKADFGIFEFQFTGALAGFSAPPRGAQWTSAELQQEVTRAALESAAGGITGIGGRSWLVVQAAAVDRGDAATKFQFHGFVGSATIGKAEVDAIAPNPEWAKEIAGRWADFASSLGCSGIHWDTLGNMAGGMEAKGADLPGFLRAALPTLLAARLHQTMNFVDGFGWDPKLTWSVGPGFVGKTIAFPVWTTVQALEQDAGILSADGRRLADDFKAVVGDSNLCLDANTAAGRPCEWGAAHQLWKWEYGQLKSQDGKCLRLKPHQDWIVETDTCHSEDWEQWEHTGSHQLRAKKTGKCADLSYDPDGRIGMGDCADENHRQEWFLAVAHGQAESPDADWIEIKPAKASMLGEGLCLGSDAQGSFGGAVKVEPCAFSSQSQKMRFDRTTGRIQIYGGRCIQLKPGEDWKMQVWVCKDVADQKFEYDEASMNIRAKKTGKCVSYNSFAQGAEVGKIFLGKCDADNEDSKWSLVPFDPIDHYFTHLFKKRDFVWSCWPGHSEKHVGEPQNRLRVGDWPLDLLVDRWRRAVRNGGTLLAIGDGRKYGQAAHSRDLSGMGAKDVDKIREAVNLPSRAQPVTLRLVATSERNFNRGPIQWALHVNRCLHAQGTDLGAKLVWSVCEGASDWITPVGTGSVCLWSKPDMCINVPGDGFEDGSPLHLWSKGSTTWTVPQWGQGLLKTASPRAMCLQNLHEAAESPATIKACDVTDPNQYVLAAWKPPDPVPATMGPLRGHYGALTQFNDEVTEDQVREQVKTMFDNYGVREFQFYDCFESYSHPPHHHGHCSDLVCRKDGPLPEMWVHNHGKHVWKGKLQAAIDQIEQIGGRSWYYVQAVGAERHHMANGIGKGFKDVGCYTHGAEKECHSFQIIVINAAWAMRFVPQWGSFVRELGASGIHWDQIGDWEMKLSKVGADFPGFLRASLHILKREGLEQTINFVNGYGWDPTLMWDINAGWVGRAIAFPYWEVWSPKDYKRYEDYFRGRGVSFVSAQYPGKTCQHDTTGYDRDTNGHLAPMCPLDVGIRRFKRLVENGGSYVFFTSGNNYIQDPLFDDHDRLTDADIAKLQKQLQLPPGLPPA